MGACRLLTIFVPVLALACVTEDLAPGPDGLATDSPGVGGAGAGAAVAPTCPIPTAPAWTVQTDPHAIRTASAVAPDGRIWTVVVATDPDDDEQATLVSTNPDGTVGPGPFELPFLTFGFGVVFLGGMVATDEGVILAGPYDVSMVSTTDGSIRWSQPEVIWAYSSSPSIAAGPGGDVYAATQFQWPMTIGGSIYTPKQGDFGSGDILVVRLDGATGAVRWVKQFGGTGMEWSPVVRTGSDGGPWVTGAYEYGDGSLDFGAGPMGADPGGYGDAYVAHLTPDGAHVASTRLHADNTGGSDLAIAADGAAFVLDSCTASACPPADFGGGPRDGNLLHLVKLAPNLTYAWDFELPAALELGYLSTTIAADGCGGVVAAGAYTAPIDVGLGPVPLDGAANGLAFGLAADGTTAWQHRLEPVGAAADDVQRFGTVHMAADGAVLVDGTFTGSASPNGTPLIDDDGAAFVARWLPPTP